MWLADINIFKRIFIWIGIEIFHCAIYFPISKESIKNTIFEKKIFLPIQLKKHSSIFLFMFSKDLWSFLTRKNIHNNNLHTLICNYSEYETMPRDTAIAKEELLKIEKVMEETRKRHSVERQKYPNRTTTHRCKGSQERQVWRR